MDLKYRRVILWLSLVLAVFLFFVSFIGFTDSPYERETEPWKLQCIGQDLIDLTLVGPALVLSALLLEWRPRIGQLVWPGVILYLIYTFTIYCFDVHFNPLFLEYCLILGLSVYSLMYFVWLNRNNYLTEKFQSAPVIYLTATYLLVVAFIFSALWLLDVVHAIRAAGSPNKLSEVQLPTNPVHVLDLSLFLPAFFIAAFLIMQRRSLGLHLAAHLLSFSTLMNLTILVLDMLEEDNRVMRGVFSTMALLSFILLLLLIRHLQKMTKAILTNENTSH